MKYSFDEALKQSSDNIAKCNDSKSTPNSTSN
jgi:hypothetical protein